LLFAMPVFAAGSIALGLALVGYVPAAAGASALPIILATTGLGLLICTIWAAALAQSMVASLLGLFAGFWLSYTVLVLGVVHSWFAIPADDVRRSTALFLITWAIIFGAALLASVRLPLAFILIIALVLAAVVLLIFGTLDTNTTLTKAAGWVSFAFAAVGIYVFLSAAEDANGGSAYPIGPPLRR
jgi:succinate-acetate transporter protein